MIKGPRRGGRWRSDRNQHKSQPSPRLGEGSKDASPACAGRRGTPEHEAVGVGAVGGREWRRIEQSGARSTSSSGAELAGVGLYCNRFEGEGTEPLGSG